MGAKNDRRDRRYFRGSISCMQVLGRDLSRRAILKKKTRCFRRRPRPPQPSPVGKVCKAKIDLGFLIDGSGSIEHYGRGNFRRCLNFVKNMVGAFHISSRFTRISVILFSSRARLLFSFRSYRNKRQVLKAISRIRYPRGGTKIGRALNYARARMFGRGRRKKVLIVMTDGKSSDRVSGPSAALKRIGVTTISFGIGRKYNMRQLIQIATSRRHVYTASFRTMNRVVRGIKRKACQGVKPPRPTPLAKRALAVYPLNSNTRGRDISLSRNPAARLVNVRPAPGPDKTRGGAYRFLGKVYSYAEFRNTGKLDAKNSITLLAWIKPSGRPGPIFNYNPRGWGVHFWVTSRRQLFIRFTRRNRHQPAPVVYNGLKQNRWQFVGATYSKRTGVGKLFVNHRFVARRYIGRFQLATNYPVRMGAKNDRRDRRYFSGSISCMQVLGRDLSRQEILKKKIRCFRIVPQPPRPLPIGKVCHAKIDLAFLIDGSGSIEYYGRGNFRRCLNFVKNMASAFRISPRHTRVAASVFSSSTRRAFSFGSYRNKQQVLNAIGRIRYPRGGTKIGRALNYARRRMFGRSRRKKVLIVMTDGRSSDKTTIPARNLRRMGVEIFALGIGRGFAMSQLMNVATDRSHTLTASFRNMNSVVRIIKSRACKGTRPIPPRPSGTLRAVGLYPLNALVKGRDVSMSRNPAGLLRNVRPAPGPDGFRGTAYQFYGSGNSYIQLPNRGKLDTKRSITILAQIFHSGRAGPIVQYNTKRWGVHLWMRKQNTLYVRFTKRKTLGATASLSSKSISLNRWQYVGTTYDHRSGYAKLYVNGRLVKKRRIGRIYLATEYPIRIGAKKNDGRYFRGRISCVQIYGKALTGRQIAARARRCFMNKHIGPIIRPYPGPRPALPVCRAKLDIGILLDGSGSVGSRNFIRCKKFLQSLVSSFSISPHKTRVGLVVFNSRPIPKFRFSQYRNIRSLIRRIGRIRYPRGGTKTGRALWFSKKFLFRSSRKNRILIVMTDGRSYDKVSRAAASLKRMGIQIFALGVGRNYNRGQLFQMASRRQLVFTAHFKNLGSMVRTFKQKACRVSGVRPVRPVRPIGGKVCRKQINLGLLIDGSGSIEQYGRGNFQRCLAFVRNLIKSFNIGRRYTRVGVVLYSSRPYKVFGFNRFHNKNSVLAAVSKIWYPRGGTKTGKALRYTRRFLFRNTKGRRSVLVVMTDGRSQDNVSRPSNALRVSGVHVISLGIGRKYDINQLRQIASSRRDVFIAGFRNMNSVVRVIKKKACGTSGRRPVPIPPPRHKQFYHLGCFKDHRRRAMTHSLGNFIRYRHSAIRKCAREARKRGYKVFGVQFGGQCFSSRNAKRTYAKYGRSRKCRQGRGGSWASDVYSFDRPPSKRLIPYHFLGCYKNPHMRAMRRKLGNFRKFGLQHAIQKCARAAKRRAFKVFGLQSGGLCLSGRTAHRTYSQYGPSNKCRRWRGGLFATDVFKIGRKRRVKRKWHFRLIGCFKRKYGRMLADFRRVPHPVRNCAKLARRRGYTRFGMVKNGICYSAANAHLKYRRKDIVQGCGLVRGNSRFTSVYDIKNGRARRHWNYRRRWWVRRHKKFIQHQKHLKWLRHQRERRRHKRLQRQKHLKRMQWLKRARRLRRLRWLRRQKMLKRQQRLRSKRRRLKMQRLRRLHLQKLRRQQRLRMQRLKRQHHLKMQRLRRLNRLKMKRKLERVRQRNRMRLRRIRQRQRRLRLVRRLSRLQKLRRKRTRRRKRRRGRRGGRRRRKRRRGKKRGSIQRLSNSIDLGTDYSGDQSSGEMDEASEKTIDPPFDAKNQDKTPYLVPNDMSQTTDGLQKRRAISKDSHKAVKATPTPDHYWSFEGAEPTSDIRHNQQAVLENGANLVVSHDKGGVVDTRSSNNASILLGDFKGKCFSDPGKCKTKGLTVMTSLKLDQSTLSKISSSYIMSSGGQTTKARGFALVNIKNQYVLILGTKDKQWMVRTPTLPSDWFKLAFTWKNLGDLKLYVNGKLVARGQSASLARAKDEFTTLTMGRPNNSNTSKYRLGLEVHNIALWERALTDQQIVDVMKSGVTIPTNDEKPPSTKSKTD